MNVANPYFEVVHGALHLTKQHWREFVRALSWPIGLMVGIEIYSIAAVDAGREVPSWLWLPQVVITIWAMVISAVVVHRTLILGETGRGPVLRWTSKEIRYAFYCLGLIMMFLPLCALAFVPIAGPILFIIALAVLLSRLSLVLPAVAVEHPTSFGDAWNQSKGRALLMAFAVLIFPLILGLVGAVFEFLPLATVLVPIAGAIVMLLSAASLSMAYKLVVVEVGSTPNIAMEQPRADGF